jgi:hypothetical protein
MMISVKVSYTVSPDFIAQNKKNISVFLADFKKLNTLNFFYNVFLQEDGLTFLHISMYEDETVQHQILNVPSFITFQTERDASGLTVSQQMENLTLVGSSLGLLS